MGFKRLSLMMLPTLRKFFLIFTIPADDPNKKKRAQKWPADKSRVER
jgi:hypothetical protein